MLILSFFFQKDMIKMAVMRRQKVMPSPDVIDLNVSQMLQGLKVILPVC